MRTSNKRKSGMGLLKFKVEENLTRSHACMHACMQQMGRLESWDETDSWFGIQVSIPIT